MEKRDIFDYNNLGGFRRSFPNLDSNRQFKYEEMLEESKLVWNEFTNGIKRTTDPMMSPNPNT